MPLAKVVGYQKDAEDEWVAVLACGHTRHLRHRPPWELRPWVLTEEGRAAFLGTDLNCTKCEDSPSPLTIPPTPV
ncbi:DUF3565 domain-containing protein [Bryobacter aggregatus]|uniref:DUF3565 domain-containing protein n=1 Tax=Bryobacter aggregatus TaxID=360054 RepID=UPI00192E6E39